MLVLGLLWGASSCAYASTAPARQLEDGQSLTTGSMSWGLARAGPRVELGKRWGGDTGDLGIHGGWTALFAANAGASARAYLARWLTASLHVDGGLLLPIESGVPGWLAWTTRWTTTTTDSRPFFGGVQGHYTHYFREGFGTPIYTGGFLGGIEFPMGQMLGQIELVWTPFAHQPLGDRDPQNEPRMTVNAYGVAPGPYTGSVRNLVQNTWFSQVNFVVYNW